MSVQHMQDIILARTRDIRSPTQIFFTGSAFFIKQNIKKKKPTDLPAEKPYRIRFCTSGCINKLVLFRLIVRWLTRYGLPAKNLLSNPLLYFRLH